MGKPALRRRISDLEWQVEVARRVILAASLMDDWLWTRDALMVELTATERQAAESASAVLHHALTEWADAEAVRARLTR